jgi:cytochrome oxidase Cu insertion factor (SCO1/SenC/PrrC family)
MQLMSRFVIALLVAVFPAAALAQPPKKSEDDFVKEKPTLGDILPDITIYNPDGTEVKTSSWRGHHTVLVFGCLT